jgi:hypothetical protein
MLFTLVRLEDVELLDKEHDVSKLDLFAFLGCQEPYSVGPTRRNKFGNTGCTKIYPLSVTYFGTLQT